MIKLLITLIKSANYKWLIKYYDKKADETFSECYINRRDHGYIEEISKKIRKTAEWKIKAEILAEKLEKL